MLQKAQKNRHPLDAVIYNSAARPSFKNLRGLFLQQMGIDINYVRGDYKIHWGVTKFWVPFMEGGSQNQF